MLVSVNIALAAETMIAIAGSDMTQGCLSGTDLDPGLKNFNDRSSC